MGKWLRLGLGLYIVIGMLAISLQHPSVMKCEASAYRWDRFDENHPDRVHVSVVSLQARFLLFEVLPNVLFLSLLFLFAIPSANSLKWLLLTSLIFIEYIIALKGLELLKRYSNDYECNQKPNGISGHSFYAVRCIGTLYLLLRCFYHDLSTYKPPKWLSMIVSYDPTPHLYPIYTLILYALFVFAILPNILFTFYYGYHSLYQMILGSYYGLCYLFIQHIQYKWIFPPNPIKQA